MKVLPRRSRPPRNNQGSSWHHIGNLLKPGCSAGFPGFIAHSAGSHARKLIRVVVCRNSHYELFDIATSGWWMGPSVDWWQAEFGQELLEGRDGMQIVEGRVRRYIDGLVGVPVIAGFQVLKCLLRVS